jgi:hypothetical protein
MAEQMRGPFEKFVNSSYYSKSELCGGVVAVSFSKYFPWQAMHFLQRSTHFSKRKRSNKVNPRTFQTALVIRVRKMRNAYKNLVVGKPEGKSQVRRPRKI